MILTYLQKIPLSTLNWHFKNCNSENREISENQKIVNLAYKILKSKPFLMVSLVFFDSEQLLIHKPTPKNASKYPKLACAILHPAGFRGLKMCENQIFLTRPKHKSYHKYGIGI